MQNNPFSLQKDNILVEVTTKDTVQLVMPASLSASITQSQEVLRKKTYGNHASILFWPVRISQEQLSLLLIEKKIICFSEKLVINPLQKQSSQTFRHQSTVKIIFSTKLPFLCRNRENSKENEYSAIVIYLLSSRVQYRWLQCTRPVLHCHGHSTSSMHKLLDTSVREPMNQFRPRIEEYSNTTMISRNKELLSGDVKIKQIMCSDLHHIQSEINTGDAALPHNVPGFSQQHFLKITGSHQDGCSGMLQICA